MTQVFPKQEEETVKAFIVRERRERWLELLASSKHRHKITKSLAHPHPSWFDSRYVKAIPANASILALLRSKGAPEKCWAISERSDLDQREVELDSALEEIVGSGMGTILCCVPGKLAYVESEDGRFLLERR